jgi:hypothetical protein
MTLHRVLSFVLYAVMIVSAILVGLFYFGGIVEGTEGTSLEEPTITNTIINWTYVLFFVAAIAAVLFPIIYMIMHPANAKKAGIAILGLAVIVFIGYSLASGELLQFIDYTGNDNNPKTLKLAGTGIITTYLLLGAAVLAIIYSEIAKMLK